MAKKANSVNKQTFRDLLKELKENAVKLPAVESREERKYFLIVTEGARTEPIYFRYLANKLPKNLVQTIEVEGAGDNTVNCQKGNCIKR